MRTETTTRTLYKYNELSEDSKQKALEKLWDINVSDSFWYEGTFEDAKTIGAEIVGFDTDRGNYCEMKFSSNYLIDVAKLITKHHGETCETYKLATNYINSFDKLDKDQDQDENYEKLQDLNEDFIAELQNEYLSILRQNYEYLTSKDSIIETIECNEYEFTEDGELA